MPKEPRPRATGYNAAYRMKLEAEFIVSGRMHRLPRWMKEAVSLMLKEIENNRARISELELALFRAGPTKGRA